jgi:transmembrane sensor
MITIPEHIAIILEKKLKGLQSAEDMQVLEQWRMEKKEHALLLEQLTKLWQESGVLLEEPVYDTEKAWEKLDRSLNQGKSNNVRYQKATNSCLPGRGACAGKLDVFYVCFRE